MRLTKCRGDGGGSVDQLGADVPGTAPAEGVDQSLSQNRMGLRSQLLNNTSHHIRVFGTKADQLGRGIMADRHWFIQVSHDTEHRLNDGGGLLFHGGGAPERGEANDLGLLSSFDTIEEPDHLLFRLLGGLHLVVLLPSGQQTVEQRADKPVIGATHRPDEIVNSALFRIAAGNVFSHTADHRPNCSVLGRYAIHAA